MKVSLPYEQRKFGFRPPRANSSPSCFIALSDKPTSERQAGISNGLHSGRICELLCLEQADVAAPSRERLGGRCIGGEAINQGIEGHAAAGAGPEIPVHHDPGLKIEPELPRQNPGKLRISGSQRNLAHPDAKPRPNGGKLRQVTVGPQCKIDVPEATHAPEHAADCWGLTVEPNEVMPA